jgi:hypothetical protein
MRSTRGSAHAVAGVNVFDAFAGTPARRVASLLAGRAFVAAAAVAFAGFRPHGRPLPPLRRATRVVRVGGAAALLAMSACGGGENSSKSSAIMPAVPERLLGTYTMSLKASDLPPSPPPELTDQAKHWTMKITTTGAATGGPALELINNALGSLEQPALRVHGHRLVLQHEECASTSGPAPYTYVTSEYSWSIVGRHLRLSAVTVGCPDHAASTLLTAEPWTRR